MRPLSDARDTLAQSRRIVVKVGSALLARAGPRIFSRYARDIAALVDEKRQVVVVSSGAIALGLAPLRLHRRPKELSRLQAAAAVGQIALMERWGRALRRHDRPVAQVLLSHADLASRERFLNARHALITLMERGAIPIINENDSVATDEIRVGDNDTLSAQVAVLMGADALIILTTVDGLFTGNPEVDPTAQRVPLVHDINSVRHFAAGAGNTGLGVGGMHTKITAATMATRHGIPVVITAGARPRAIAQVAAGRDLGTLFVPSARIGARRHWIAYTLKPQGALVVDAGAVTALTERRKSLLPSGIVEVRGDFSRGAMVEIVGPHGVFARGLTAYSAEEVMRIAGKKSDEIERVLGYTYDAEVVSRDDLALLE